MRLTINAMLRLGGAGVFGKSARLELLALVQAAAGRTGRRARCQSAKAKAAGELAKVCTLYTYLGTGHWSHL